MHIYIYIYIIINTLCLLLRWWAVGPPLQPAPQMSQIISNKILVRACLNKQQLYTYIYIYISFSLSLYIYIYIYVYIYIYIYIYSERGEIHCCFWFTSIQVPFGMGMALSGPGLGPFSARSGAALRRDTANLRPNHNDNNNNDNHNYYYDCGIQRIWLKRNLNLKGWNSRAHRETSGKFELSNPSRDNHGRKTGHTRRQLEHLVHRQVAFPFWFRTQMVEVADIDSARGRLISCTCEMRPISDLRFQISEGLTQAES